MDDVATYRNTFYSENINENCTFEVLMYTVQVYYSTPTFECAQNAPVCLPLDGNT